MASSSGEWKIEASGLSWKSSDSPFKLWDWVEVVAIMTAMYAAMMIFVWVLAVLLLTVVVLLKGESWVEMILNWLSPDLWLGGLGIALALAAIPMLIGLFLRHVTAYRFDVQQQQLVITQQYAGFRPFERRYAWNSIVGIYPFASESSSSSAGLRVVLNNAKGKEFTRYIGEGQSQSALEAQAQWLQNHLGEKVHDLVVYAGD
ncbi:hypothetical protein DZC30_21140 [Comamonas testosteroni]|uniref:Uncharacterized protein n=1 Tax=Comamonas testosteroni TaxID=285 RepID=A0A373F7L5_COMTE|nr:hypothetical protein [Comamonas testosteroni]RGE39947.1 hypothetical protein DZC30_21140 [Comamonas testosteroni]